MRSRAANPDPMRILLTGGAGYIGSHTAIAVLEAGHEVVLFDNFCNSGRDVPARIETLAGRPVPVVEGDVRDTALLAATLRDREVDAVIHFAGLKAVGEAVENPLPYYDNNVRGSLGLIQAMSDAGVRTLVFSSSATVYGQPQYLPLDEAHPTGATNPYGRSKLIVEEMLADIAAAGADWRIAVLRYFNPVGAHPSGLIGEDPSGVPNNLMPFINRVAAGRLPELAVFGNDYDTPDGTGVRDYIHVSDLAAGHLAAISAIRSGTRPIETWNLGTGQGYSVLEMVRAFEAATGASIPYRIAPRRPGDVASCYADPAKAREELGWEAKLGLAEMCASGWKFERTVAESNSR